jgi:hypothetical protein
MRGMTMAEGVVFFIGNKRSGTRVLVWTINRHPDIHITLETDITRHNRLDVDLSREAKSVMQLYGYL